MHLQGMASKGNDSSYIAGSIAAIQVAARWLDMATLLGGFLVSYIINTNR